MKRFRPYFALLKPVKVQFAISILAGVVAAVASGFGLPFMMDKVFPIIFIDEQTGVAEKAPEWLISFSEMIGGADAAETLLLAACLMMPVVFLVRGVSAYVNTYFLNFTGLKVLETIRAKTFGRLQQLSLAFHHGKKEGDMLSRIMSDTTLLQNALVRVACDMIVQPCTLIAALGFLVYKSFTDNSAFFMLIGMLSIPVCVLPIRVFGKKLLKKATSLQTKMGDMTAVVSENLASQREIRAYNLQEAQSEVFEKESTAFFWFNMKVVKYRYLISPAVEIVAALGVAFAIYFGAQKGMTLQSFMPLLVALYLCYEPVKKLGNVHSALKQGEAALDRIEEVLHSNDEIHEVSNPVVIDKFKGDVSFDAVSFSYDGKANVLNEITLTVPAGQTVALVGESGAGKSSFVSLIPRFYDTSSGAVKIDEVNVAAVGKQALRDQIALVSQMPLLFRGTVRENIALGKPGAAQEEIEEAAKQARAHDFIMNDLPDGYNTVLGERGEGLSGGQRQRVAIARAFLKNAPLLILDEATSALDAESEAQIQEQLSQLAEGRTTFLIAHRFSSIRDADRILVFAKGKNGGEIISDGSHEELYGNCTVYTELYDRQS